jgi:hypothetical protein
MLGNAHFYNRTIRKIVVAFGTIFNDIHLVRYNKAGTVAYEKFKVPLSYGSKEKYLTRITSDPNLTRSVNTVVPRISFDLTGMSYDSGRKKVTTLRNFAANTSTGGLNTQYIPVPYDFSFSLSIYVRNTEDGTQILEQILPFFTPDFNVTVDFVPSMDQKYDLPIILNSVNSSTDYEGDMMTTRLIIWDLEFTVKGYIWPPVSSGGSVIGGFSNTANSYGGVYTNLFIDTQDRASQKVTIDYANGNNYFTTAETIRVDARDVTGSVVYFSNNNNGILIVGDLNKLLQVGDVIRGNYSRAKYTVTALDKNPVKSIVVLTQPNPQDAEPDDEFGFSESITEWPNTL